MNYVSVNLHSSNYVFLHNFARFDVMNFRLGLLKCDTISTIHALML